MFKVNNKDFEPILHLVLVFLLLAKIQLLFLEI